jgi:hypothetical protein
VGDVLTPTPLAALAVLAGCALVWAARRRPDRLTWGQVLAEGAAAGVMLAAGLTAGIMLLGPDR